jgi:hypothetical protein
MKKFIFSLSLLGFAIFLNAQTVDSIKVEQAGELVKIHYKILNSDASQVFRVSLSCIVSSGMKMEPRSLSGDYGENVIGGRENYMIVWDVLKDMDELQSAEFSVKAELIKGKTSGAGHVKTVNTTGWDRKKVNVQLSVLGPGPKYGLKLGYMGSFGISAGYFMGKEEVLTDPFSTNSKDKTVLYSLELTKRLINAKGFQMHIGAGYAMTEIVFTQTFGGTDYVIENCGGFAMSLTFGIKSITSTLGFAGFPSAGNKESESNIWLVSSTTYLNFGLGVRF